MRTGPLTVTIALVAIGVAASVSAAPEGRRHPRATRARSDITQSPFAQDTVRPTAPARARATSRAPRETSDADSALTPVRPTPLRSAPNGPSIGTLASGAVVVPLAHSRGAVRVRVEGWVAENLLAPADSALRGAMSAADLRADPNGSRGRLVRWNVQVFALQTADPLRHDFAPDEPYLLARGPDDENALVYLAVPPALMAQAKAIPALARVTITASVRTGRSEPAGVPILDLRTIASR